MPNTLKEEEIRPQRIFDEFLRLSKEDAPLFFPDAARQEGPCPACGGIGNFSFVKHGFDYDTCPNCDTLFVNPRPAASAFSKYYTESSSSKYWATTFYKETAAARREKLWKPKAKMTRDALTRYNASGHTVVDIGGGYGLFALEMRELSAQRVIVIEPASHLAGVCGENSLPVIEKFFEQVGRADLPAGPKAFVSFELFEHLHDPAAFVAHLSSLMASGDLFFVTTLSGTGVDIQALWENSKSVFPPHHLNFLNPRSLKGLLERLGLEVLEVSTPGKLDIGILANNPDLIKDRFWRTFIARASEDLKEQWQSLITESGWSSHMMAICRKP